jgi:hypothetical protein
MSAFEGFLHFSELAFNFVPRYPFDLARNHFLGTPLQFLNADRTRKDRNRVVKLVG